MSIGDVKFIWDSSIQESVLISKGHNKLPKGHLSPISMEILCAAMNRDISLVFAQGPLQLTPLICALLQEQSSQDILIGIPKKKFDEQNKHYMKLFYSLYKSQGFYFYDKVLWCTVKINDDLNVKLLLDSIKTRPKWGRSDFKDRYETDFLLKLRNGNMASYPKIVAIPIDHSLPSDILDNKKFYFEEQEYLLDSFSPNFIIFESVNERIYTLEPLLATINSLIEKKIGSIIHFSWPYLPKMKLFLQSLTNLTKIPKVFHLGKRYGIMMRDKFQDYMIQEESKKINGGFKRYIQDHPAFRELSLEGHSWDYYYPQYQQFTNNGDIEIGIIKTIGLEATTQFKSILEMDGPFDNLLFAIRSELEGLELPSHLKGLLLYPPFFNSFLLPREMSFPTLINDKYYRHLPIKDYIINSIPQNLGIGPFITLCEQSDSVMDFIHVLKQIETYKSMGKSSALISYLFNEINKIPSDDETDETIIIVSYNRTGLGGHSNTMMRKITDLLLFIESNDDYNKDALINCSEYFSPDGQKIIKWGSRKNTKRNIEIKHKIDSYNSKIKIEINILDVTIPGHSIKKRIEIIMTDFESIQTLSNAECQKCQILLPGPIPIFSFIDDIPLLTKGYDILLRPFKRKIFFVYPGMNLKRLLNQMQLIDGLYSTDNKNPIACKDLSISIKYNPKKLAIGIPGIPEEQLTTKEDNYEKPDDNPFDTNFRNSLIDEIKKEEGLHAKTLDEIWKSVTSVDRDSSSFSSHAYNSELIKLKVRFINMREEEIYLRAGSYVRVLFEDEYLPCLIEEIKAGQRIAYLKSEEKEGLDNYFIRNFGETKGWRLEDIMVPYTCLLYLYDALKNINWELEYDEKLFENIKWLDPIQKNTMFKAYKLLLLPSYKENDSDSLELSFKNIITESGIWKSLSNISSSAFKILKNNFEKRAGEMTYDKLYHLAKLMGLEYERNSFNALLSGLHSGGSHYFFHKSINLKIIGELIWDYKIITSYEDINNAGKNVRTVLELVGQSISRVISGKENPFNEMDQLVKRQLVLCEVVTKGD